MHHRVQLWVHDQHSTLEHSGGEKILPPEHNLFTYYERYCDDVCYGTALFPVLPVIALVWAYGL